MDSATLCFLYGNLHASLLSIHRIFEPRIFLAQLLCGSGEPIAINRAHPDFVLLLRNFRKTENSPDPRIELETLCPAVALATTRPTRLVLNSI
ncbi:hypothetical protein SFRURICE_018269 [Spodoptera frugiperda]|nr:hypothetical protein SFRURICE_018269 [Spodoptera frugiperda]